MCSCSQSDMLFQNWVAWLKWSEKLSLRAADLRAIDLFGVADEGVGRLRRMHRAAAAEAVREIRDPPLVDCRPPHGVALVVVKRD